MKLNLYAKIKSGKLDINNRRALDQWISNLKDGDDIVIKFRVQENYKSTRQLRLLYHCLREISNKTGHDVEELKTGMKLKAGLCFSHMVEDKEITVCKSISDFSIKELSEFIQFIDNWSTKTLNLPLLSYDDISFLKN